jgi:hypothetical protein
MRRYKLSLSRWDDADEEIEKAVASSIVNSRRQKNAKALQNNQRMARAIGHEHGSLAMHNALYSHAMMGETVHPKAFPTLLNSVNSKPDRQGRLHQDFLSKHPSLEAHYRKGHSEGAENALHSHNVKMMTPASYR